MIDRWCIAIAATLHLGAGSAAKLEALTAALFALFVVQAIATYYRNYWASMAGHRLIFDLRYALYQHMQRLSHSFFDRTTSGAVVSRFISDISMAQNFVGSAMINIWMDGVSLGFVIWLLFSLNVRLAWISLDHRAILRRGDQDSVAANQGDQPRPAGSGRGIFRRAAGAGRRRLDGQIVRARGRRGAPLPQAHDRNVRPDDREREAVVDPSDVHRVHLARRAADRDLGGRADDHARQNDHRHRGRVLRPAARALPAAAALLGVVGNRGDGSGGHRADLRVLRRDARSARRARRARAQGEERPGRNRASALRLQAARRRTDSHHARRREPGRASRHHGRAGGTLGRGQDHARRPDPALLRAGRAAES